MKLYWTLGILLTTGISAFSQLSPQARQQLHAKEEQMKPVALKMINSSSTEERILNDSLFTREFVQALKIPYSFNYTFDSLYTISQLYAPDSAFRIFTWQLVRDEYITRQHGAIQMRTADGSLKLFPLIDKSDVIENAADTSGDNLGWMGAVYYRIILKYRDGRKIYTLLGYDENNIRSTKKIVEVLEFRDGKPWFGGRNISVPDNNSKGSLSARYIMEFKKDASPRLTYDPELDLIVMEHLISESNEPNKKWTLIGDGDYDAFKWIDGRWTFVNKIFTEVTPEGSAPMPKPIRDAEGNVDETQLAGYEPGESSASQKNGSRQKTPVKKKN